MVVDIMQLQKNTGIYIGLHLMSLQFQVTIIRHLGILCASKNAPQVQLLILYYAKSLLSLVKTLNSVIANTIHMHILNQMEQFPTGLQ